MHGMLATMSTRVIVANLVYSNRPRKTKRIVRHLRDRHAAHHDRVVWLLVETKRGRVRGWLGRGWRTHQGWQPGRSNNTVAWDTDMGPRGGRFDLLTLPLAGAQMLTRWMNVVRTPGDWWTVLHHAPSRYSFLYPASMARMDRLYADLSHPMRGEHQTWGGDSNDAPVEQWAKEHGMNYRHAGVMFLATTHRIIGFQAVKITGLDHRVLVVDLAD